MAQLLKIKAQVSSIWAKGCILMTVCVCFIRLDMTTPPWCRDKVMVYIIIFMYPALAQRRGVAQRVQLMLDVVYEV